MAQSTVAEGTVRRPAPRRAHRVRRGADCRVTEKPAPATAPDPRELARALQFELQRVGCFTGTVNGELDDVTKAAWQRFIKLTSIKPPDTASPDAVNAVRSVGKRVCPLVCPSGQHAEGEVCALDSPPEPKRAEIHAASPLRRRPA